MIAELKSTRQPQIVPRANRPESEPRQHHILDARQLSRSWLERELFPLTRWLQAMPVADLPTRLPEAAVLPFL